jgi:hypothetical protein
MAVLLIGAKGARWTAADWVARNAFAFLRPALEKSGLTRVCALLAPSADVPPAFADLSDLLDHPAHASAWERAVGGAVAAVDAEAGAGWLEPHRFGEFRAAVVALGELVTSDGNALVVRLADQTSKILGETP